MDVLKNGFEEKGWDVATVMDGEAAIDAIQSKKFDVVLLDLLTPKKDGFEVLAEIKSKAAFKNLPILVMSSLGQQENIKKALALGATEYFIKINNSIHDIVEKAEKFGRGRANV